MKKYALVLPDGQAVDRLTLCLQERPYFNEYVQTIIRRWREDGYEVRLVELTDDEAA